jgi:hypothetical protein
MPDLAIPSNVDVWADDVALIAAVLDPRGSPPTRCRVHDGDGAEEAVYYNGRAEVDLVGPKPDAAGDGGHHRCFAHHPA